MNTNESNKQFLLDELCSLTELSKRTIRFYIQEGLVSRPEGSKRGSFYTQEHLNQLLEIQKWQRVGVSLERIKELLINPLGGETALPPPRKQPGEIEVWSHIHLGDGIQLQIEPNKAGLTPEQLRLLSQKTIELLKALKGKEKAK